MAAYLHPVRVRYLEVDREGVVFNMWYLGWFDDAMSGFLADRGMPYAALLARGLDMMLVRTEVDWSGPVRFGDDTVVAVEVERVGTTSFTLSFEVRRAGAAVCSARTVYVVTDTAGTGTRAMPADLRAVLDGARRV